MEQGEEKEDAAEISRGFTLTKNVIIVLRDSLNFDFGSGKGSPSFQEQPLRSRARVSSRT